MLKIMMEFQHRKPRKRLGIYIYISNEFAPPSRQMLDDVRCPAFCLQTSGGLRTF